MCFEVNFLEGFDGKIKKNLQKKEEKFSQQNRCQDIALATRLGALVRDLIYVSETTSPIEVFSGSEAGEVSADEISRQTGRHASDPIKEISPDEFFGRLTQMKDWYRQREIERAEGYMELKVSLETNLTDLRVFTIGRIQIDIYVVGLDQYGRLMGIRTKAVET
jgi:hypothetical protein